MFSRIFNILTIILLLQVYLDLLQWYRVQLHTRQQRQRAVTDVAVVVHFLEMILGRTVIHSGR